MPRGAYTADRAAALSGVPISTLHWWARHDILPPSLSPARVKLWSYSDLMGARIIYWLRHEKVGDDGRSIPAITMPAVRRALGNLRELDLALWSEDGGPGVRVNRTGHIFVTTKPTFERSGDRQRLLHSGPDEALEVLAPFQTLRGAKGPDLVEPRPQLRIVPGKLGGSPHVVHTRLESVALGALANSGVPTAKIYRLYPEVAPPAIDEAIDLERQLAGNLRRAA